MDVEYDKILGALLGCAIGDAMGMPAEMWSQRRIRAQFGEITDFLPGPPDNAISAGFAPYETTDDSIVTALVAQTLIDSDGAPKPLELVRRIEAWARENPKSKTIIGPSTQRAFEQIARGVPAEEAGRTGETNGASMRISPVGAICSAEDLPALVEQVSNICMPTHNTAAAISGACAVAAGVAHGVAGGAPEETAALMLRAAELGAQKGYEGCGPSVAERLRLSLKLSDSLVDDEAFLRRQYALVGCGLPSCESVPSALAIALRCKFDVLRCARMCANIGGDTDTMGAIACAVSGAHTGAHALPEKVVAHITVCNALEYQTLAKGLTALRRKRLCAPMR